jgi:CDP-4-dehydro-6-deoxyglucose reductase
MPDTLSLSRAARLANVSRGDLQARLKDLKLEMFEGKITIADLLQAYPDIDIDADPTLERLATIREDAFAKRGRKDTQLPNAEVLMARLHDFHATLTRTKAALNNAELLVRELSGELDDALEGDDRALREHIGDLQRRLLRATKANLPAKDREAALFAKDALLSLMSASVRLRPSGHEFFVAGQDSVLEGALKAGLHLDYGCASGNCGQCKVRVLSGRVKQVRDYDYALSAREQEDGYMLACSNTPVTDLLIEAHEAAKPGDLPHQEIRVRVRKQIPLGDNAMLLQVQTPRTDTLRFMAGQRVKLTSDSGTSIELPVASCPCDARNLQFLLRRDTCAALIEEINVDAALTIDGPHGDFLLREESVAPAVFLSVGDGIAPIKSLVEHAITIDNAEMLHLFRIDDIPVGSHLGNLCRAWNDALDNFTYTRLPEASTPEKALDAIEKRVVDIGACELYVAGPTGWVESMRAVLRTRGMDHDKFQMTIVGDNPPEESSGP